MSNINIFDPQIKAYYEWINIYKEIGILWKSLYITCNKNNLALITVLNMNIHINLY